MNGVGFASVVAGLIAGLEALRALLTGRPARRLALIQSQQEILDGLHASSTARADLESLIDADLKTYVEARTTLRWRWGLVTMSILAGTVSVFYLLVALVQDRFEWGLTFVIVMYAGWAASSVWRAAPAVRRSDLIRALGFGRSPSPSGS